MKYLSVLVLSFLMSCGSSDIREQSTSVEPTIIVNSSDRDKYWIIEKNAFPRMPRNHQNEGTLACVNIAFSISKDGRVYDPELFFVPEGVHSDFIDESLKTATALTFEPSMRNSDREAIRTNWVFAYIAHPEGVRQEEINDISSKLQKLCEADLTS